MANGRAATAASIRPAGLFSPRTGVRIAAPFIAVLLALVAGAFFIVAIGENPFSIYALMARETFGTGYGLGQTLFKATPLLFAGLAVALGFRAGLFNIGVEGQLYLGAFSSAMIGTAFASSPPTVLLPLTLGTAALVGAVWGAIPGALKARFGAHEVINTIMMNFIAFALVAWIGRYVFEPATVRTATIGAGAVLPRLDAQWPALRGSPVNASLLIGLAAVLAMWLFLAATRRGFELRALGLNAPAAEYGGVHVGRAQVTAMALSGAIAGLGGVNFVQGYKHFFELGFSAGVGFVGIAVALIGRNHPLGVVIAAVLFGALGHGGLVINERVPKELVDVLQAIVILLAICMQQVMERLAQRMR